ncbi:MarR family winged helix-turn-helix transcriptional regulator [Streptomyces sp. DSM 41972]|uniref:MarR family winged helix-turn-helix transcriptional regulator n=1 Tax=Streptomyces althioticus subsp. attaecolombicae TaxID=3075534 RepID=A0ABU3HSY0_9ACTN|nr:MarR family winged helix-turn-helix transcriptional regulator [Streptomyces sp. DSM 41972]SCD40184.1 transcriptional regulator, MarR family [Streptomyces sp. di50b]SCE47164.1 transcriptional regulator, MarR family [Streptomyces sp. di188]
MSTNREEGTVRWLTTEEERAWRAFRRMVIAVQTRTVQDLAAHGLSEPDYEVLSTLSERPEGTSTLHEQAAKMGWSRSRLSRHATRMEARDLIRRAPDPTDGRGCLLALTGTGWDALRQAAPAHLDSVRRHFVDRLEPEELAALGRIAEKIVDER